MARTNRNLNLVAIATAVMLASACGQQASAPDREEAVDAPSATAAAAPVVQRDIARDFTVVLLAENADFPTWARDNCGSRSFCKVGVWTDPDTLPRGFPMTDREVEAMAFMYSINRDSGFEQLVWDCARFPQPDPSSCT